MNYHYMNYVYFGYKDPNINKYIRGINNAYKKDYIDNTTSVQRLKKIVHDKINNVSLGLINKTVLPDIPLNSKASNALEAQNFIKARNKYEGYQNNPKERAKYINEGTTYRSEPLISNINNKKTAVGVAFNIDKPDGNTILNVIGTPKYSGSVLRSSRDYIKERPDTMFEILGLTPKHDYLYNKYLSNNPMPNVKLKKS